VYRILSRLGFTQHRIGTMTGQSQSEISAIMSSRRVLVFGVLARIADGLGIPPGYLGLACCPCRHTMPEGTSQGVANDAVAAAVTSQSCTELTVP